VRTNAVLDDELIREAMKLANVIAMREAAEAALRRYVHSGRQRRLVALKGTGGIGKDYDYKRMRSAG